jgi:GntR family transcriptional regulator
MKHAILPESECMMSTINRRSKVPYYQQLYEILRSKIVQREWKPGDQIPGEAELMEAYEVSRNTVRDVLDMLVNEGLIYRHRGRGSFVAEPSLEQVLIRIVSFTEDMRRRAIQPSSRVLATELLSAPEEIASRLEIAPGDELALLRRLRLGNDEPMSIEESYFVHRYCPGFLERHDYSQDSLREVMAQDYGIRWSSAKQTIRAVNATREQSDVLQVPAKSALLEVERITYDEQYRPVEFLRIYYRGDRYSLYNELNG